MITNIDIDVDLMEKARRVTGLRTKKAVVEAGLRALIQLNEQADVRKLWGKLPLQEPEPKGKGRAGRR